MIPQIVIQYRQEYKSINQSIGTTNNDMTNSAYSLSWILVINHDHIWHCVRILLDGAVSHLTGAIPEEQPSWKEPILKLVSGPLRVRQHVSWLGRELDSPSSPDGPHLSPWQEYGAHFPDPVIGVLYRIRPRIASYVTSGF